MKRNTICIVNSRCVRDVGPHIFLSFEFVFCIAIWRFYTLIRWRWLKNKPKRPRKQFHVILLNILNEVYALITALIYALIGLINLSWILLLIYREPKNIIIKKNFFNFHR